MKRAYNIFVWRNLPPCKDIVRTLSDSLGRKLTLREKIITKLHLAACPPCVRYLEQSKFLQRILGEIGPMAPASPHDHLSDEARERIKRSLGTAAGLLGLLTSF